MSNLSREEIERRLRCAIGRLRERDGYLLDVDVNERSVTHWLANYIQEEFPTWNVDVEYNRDRKDPKRQWLSTVRVPTNDLHGDTVYPDIIVHHRNSDNNLVVVEVKKEGGEAPAMDEKKLMEFTKPTTQHGLGYRFGLLLVMRNGQEPSWAWFSNGMKEES